MAAIEIIKKAIASATLNQQNPPPIRPHVRPPMYSLLPSEYKSMTHQQINTSSPPLNRNESYTSNTLPYNYSRDIKKDEVKDIHISYPTRSSSSDSNASHRDRSRSRDRNVYHRDRSSSRDRYKSSRDRSRSRDRYKSTRDRSRSRDRHKSSRDRSHSRDRYKSSRDRSRSRDRYKSSRDRSRSRDRYKSSRDRYKSSRDRSRSREIVIEKPKQQDRNIFNIPPKKICTHNHDCLEHKLKICMKLHPNQISEINYLFASTKDLKLVNEKINQFYNYV